MNSFVNPHQRGVELPSGCKELIDMLRKQGDAASTQEPARFEGFDHVKHYVAAMWQAKAIAKWLVISSPAIRPTAMILQFGQFQLGRRPSGPSAWIYIDGTEPLLETAVRMVFEEAGSCQFAGYGVGGGVEPMRVLVYPLPDVAEQASDLIIAVFERGFGLTRDSRLAFNYHDFLAKH